MAVTPGHLVTPRGQVTKYFYHRTDVDAEAAAMLDYSDHDYVVISETNGLQNVAGSGLDGIAQSTVTALNVASFNTTTVSGNELVLTYNPKTDQYSIQRGSHVL